MKINNKLEKIKFNCPKPHDGRTMKDVAKIILLVFAFLFFSVSVHSGQKADSVLIVKSEAKLYLLQNGLTFASFPVTFGSNPRGHKKEQGDGRTPEGQYILDYKNANSAYYKSIHISYPNAEDWADARRRGVDPGGDIMIHGQKNGYGRYSFVTQFFNWTNGCIALSDKDMDIVWKAIDSGTPIEIRP